MFMKRSKYQLKGEQDLVKKTIKFYKQGMTYRQIEPLIGRSRQWISNHIREKLPEAFEIDKP